MKKVLILIPTADVVQKDCYASAISQDYGNFQVLLSVTKPKEFHKSENVNFHDNIVDHKNYMRDLALKSDADYFMWLDSDVVLPKNAVSNLMMQLEQPPFDEKAWANLKAQFPTVSLAPKKKHIIGGWYKLKKSPLWNAGLFVAHKTLQSLPFPQVSVIRVDKIDLGCVMISREVFEKIKLKNGTEWKINNRHGACECLMFANEAVELGYELFMDGSVICQHKWKGALTWRFKTSLKKLMEAVIRLWPVTMLPQSQKPTAQYTI